MVIVKADLHIHANEDPEESFINHSAKDIVDVASEKGFKVLSFTLHNFVFDDVSLRKYAKRKGILLILGVERNIEGKHVLLYGVNNEDIDDLHCFDDLRLLRKRKNILVVAPHPFYPNLLGRSCLKDKLFEHKDLFDAVEVQQVFTRWFNPNIEAIRFAKRFKKGVVANSDSHLFSSFGNHYSLLDLPENFNKYDVFDAVRCNKRVVFKPMSLISFLKFIWCHIYQRL